MGCSRGKASPDTNTQRRLFSASGGYCQNPNCNQELFVDTGSKNVSIAEMAHIIAAQDDGPRANPELTEAERGKFSNLILLCANCHTLIDKAPGAFPDSLIIQWKNEHEARISAVFKSISYNTRADAHKALKELMVRTNAVHRRVGPDNDYKWNPEADEAVEWRYHVRQTIIPTNRSILALLDHNHSLLLEHELETVELFRQHVEAMEQRHIFNSPLPSAPIYPEGMGNIFEFEADHDRS